MAEVLPFYVVIFTGIPETTLFLLLGFQLFNDRIELKQAIIISIIGSVANYLIRAQNVIFGIHTIGTLIILIIVSYFTTKKNIWKISSAIVCGTIIFLFVEWLLLYILRICNTDIIELVPIKPWLNIILAVPPTLFIGILYLITYKSNFHLFNDMSYELEQKIKS